METALAAHDGICDALTWLLLRLALAIETYRRWARGRSRRLWGSVRKLLRVWLLHRGKLPFVPRRNVPWNKTPAHIEERVVHLHVEQPQLGVGQLMRLAERVLGFTSARETFRQILIRRRELVVELEEAKRRRRRRIVVSGAGQLWGIDFTLLWVLGVFPTWVLGLVDYHGSRVLAFERVRWATSAELVRVLSAAVDTYGAPERLLSDRGPQFTSAEFEALCASRGMRHILIRPALAWTNGRIERLFRTFKETVFQHIWLFACVRQVDRFCADFRRWYNRDRPHSSFRGRTPDEVFFGRPKQPRSLGRVDYFDGHLHWYRFGPAG